MYYKVRMLTASHRFVKEYTQRFSDPEKAKEDATRKASRTRRPHAVYMYTPNREDGGEYSEHVETYMPMSRVQERINAAMDTLINEEGMTVEEAARTLAERMREGAKAT